MNNGKKSLSILTAIQMIFFGLVVLTAVVVKLLGDPVYPTVERWYSERLHDSVLANLTPESQVTSQLSSAVVAEPSRGASSPDASAPSQLGDRSAI